MNTTANNAKMMRNNMRIISKMLNQYEAAEKAQDKAHNNREYDACLKQMKDAYLIIVMQMNDMLTNVEYLGHMSDALDIKQNLDIVVKEYDTDLNVRVKY